MNILLDCVIYLHNLYILKTQFNAISNELYKKDFFHRIWILKYEKTNLDCIKWNFISTISIQIFSISFFSVRHFHLTFYAYLKTLTTLKLDISFLIHLNEPYEKIKLNFISNYNKTLLTFIKPYNIFGNNLSSLLLNANYSSWNLNNGVVKE